MKTTLWILFGSVVLWIASAGARNFAINTLSYGELLCIALDPVNEFLKHPFILVLSGIVKVSHIAIVVSLLAVFAAFLIGA